jgi:hypothetical protein
VQTIEIYVLEGECLNKIRRKALERQGKFIVAIQSAARLGHLLQKKIFFDSVKRVGLSSSADCNTIVFGHFDRPAHINASHL